MKGGSSVATIVCVGLGITKIGVGGSKMEKIVIV